jgi:N utilization substance protein A
MITKKKQYDDDLISSFAEFAKTKNIDRPTTIRIIEDVFKTILKKKYGDNTNFDVIVNIEKGDLEIWRNREIVDDEFAEDSFDYDENKHISLTDARKVADDFEIGEELSEEIKIEDFGRRNVLIARQALIQKIKDLDNYLLIQRYEELLGEIIHGEVVGFTKEKDIIVHDALGKELLIPKSEQIFSDRYKKGDSIKALVYKVEEDRGKPIITLSRTRNLFLERLMENEISEVGDGLIAIKRIVREAGDKAKVLVESYDDRIDPVGACVGSKGSRINPIVRELRNEKIDIINFTENFDLLVHRVMSPAKISDIKVEAKKVVIFLNNDQVPLAIGKKGVNIKLASKLLDKQVEIFRDYVAVDDDDVDIQEFSDEIDSWIIEEFRKVGLDTAKQVLALEKDDLITRTDLEEETIDNILKILSSEFE